MSAEDTIQPKFYSVWPNLGKKFSKQLGEIRTDTSSLQPVVRGIGLDAAGDFSSLDGIAANSVQAYEIGQQDFHNRFRTHYNKDTDVFEIASNTGTTTVPQWYTMWWVDRDGHVTQQNTPTTASNVGGGAGVFKQKVGVDLEFKSLTATSPITLTEGASTIDVDGSALVSTYSSDQAAASSGDAGVGVEIILSDTGKVGNDLPFKAIKAGPNVVVSNTGTAIQIESTAQVVEFYGISVGHDDGSVNYPEVHNFLVNRRDFYVTQQKSNPSAKTIILNATQAFDDDLFVHVIGDDMTGPLAQADGAAALPSYTFTGDTSMGLSRNAANDLAVSIAGAHHTRFLSDRLFLAQQLQVTSSGSAAAPDIFWFPDSDTGLYQDALGSISFATEGVRAGYFDHGQNFYVTDSFFASDGTAANPSMSFASQPNMGFWKAANRTLGIAVDGVNYISIGSLIVSSGVPVSLPAASAASPSLRFSGASNTGLYKSTVLAGGSTEEIGISANGNQRLLIGDAQITPYTFIRSTVDGSAANAEYSWSSDPNTGLFRKGTDSLGFTSGGEAGYFDANQNLYVTNAVIAGNGLETAPSFTFVGATGHGLYANTGGDTMNAVTNQSRRQFWHSTASGFFVPIWGHQAGAVGAPSYSFWNDVTTGVYQNANADGSVAFASGGVRAGYFDANQDLYVTNDIFAGGGVVTFKESEANGAAYFSNTVAFDSQRFYVSSGGDTKPLVSLNESVFTAENHQGLHNINKLNDGGLGADEAMGMSIGAGSGLVHFYVSNTRAGRAARDTMNIQFDGVDYAFTPPDPFELTAGDANSPALRYLWIQLNGGVPTLTEGVSNWPSNTPHARLATAVIQSATEVEIHGALKLQAWTDHPSEPAGAGAGTRGSRGHLHALAERLRVEPAVWISGANLSAPTETQIAPANPLYIQTTSGVGYQMHNHTIPSFDSDDVAGDSDPIFVVNAGDSDFGDSGTSGKYMEIHALEDISNYSTDVAIGNADHYTVIIWASINENQQNSHLFVNVPSDGYGTSSAALTDANGFRNYQLPQAYLGTAIYLCEIQIGRSGGGTTYTVENVVDLRGTPGQSIGGTGTSSAGEANTASNLSTGTGTGIFAQKNSVDLEFKTLKAYDESISITNDADQVFIGATGSFYQSLLSVEGPDAILLVGDAQHADSIVEMYDHGGLAYTMGFDHSSLSWKLASGVFDHTNDILEVTPLPDGTLSVFGDVNASRMEAGIGVFYTSTFIGDGTVANPALAFNSAKDVGIYRTDLNEMAFTWQGAQRMRFAANFVTFSKPVAAPPGTLTIPGVSWSNDSDSGMYQQLGSGTDRGNVAFTVSGTQVARVHDGSPFRLEEAYKWQFNYDIIADDNILVLNDVLAGRVEAGIGKFYTSLNVDGDVTVNPTFITYSDRVIAVGGTGTKTQTGSGILAGEVASGATLQSTSIGSIAFGYVKEGTIEAGEPGSFAHGYTKVVNAVPSGTALISTTDTAPGSFAQGYVKADESPAFIKATGPGSFAQGAAAASGGGGYCYITASAAGAFAQGQASGNANGVGSITASAIGSFAHGQARSQTVNYSGLITASGAGSVALGKAFTPNVTSLNSSVLATETGSFAIGYAKAGTLSSAAKGASTAGYVNTGSISATLSAKGGFAQGYTANDGTITVSQTGSFAQGKTNYGGITVSGSGSFAQGTATGYYGSGYYGNIISSGSGSFAQGSASADQYNADGAITAGNDGSFAQGWVYYGTINSLALGSFTQGASLGGNIVATATAQGAFAQGFASGYRIYCDGAGSFAQGLADTGNIDAIGAGSVQFGVGSNTIANSLQVGSAIHFIPGAQSRIDDELLVKDNLEVWNDVASGRIQAGVCQFYTLVGFYDKPPIKQPAAVADSGDGGDTATQLNALLARLRSLGLIDI